MADVDPNKNLMTPYYRLVWDKALYKPEAYEPGQKERYSARGLIPKVPTDPKQKAALDALIAACKCVENEAMKGKKGAPSAIGYEDGDAPAHAGKGYEGNWVINPKSDYKPGLVQPYLDPATGKLKIIADEKTIYSGCWVRARVDVYWSDKGKGAGGVFLQLNSVQFVRHDTPFAQTRTGEEDYEPIEQPPEDDDELG